MILLKGNEEAHFEYNFRLYLRPMEGFNFGAVAAILTTTAFLPQAFKVIRTGETKSLSLTMLLFMFVGTVLWAFHGFALGDKPMIYANITTSTLNAVILGIKIKAMLREKKAKS